MKEQDQTRENTDHAWRQIENQLNLVLQHLKDGAEVGNLEERSDEIRRHVRAAKDLYDWLDNFAVLSPV